MAWPKYYWVILALRANSSQVIHPLLLHRRNQNSTQQSMMYDLCSPHSLLHIDCYKVDKWMINTNTISIQNYKWNNTILASKYKVCILSFKEILQKLNVHTINNKLVVVNMAKLYYQSNFGIKLYIFKLQICILN